MYHALAVAIALAAAAPASANDSAATPKSPLQLRPKAGVVNLAPNHRFAPFVEPTGQPEPELLPRHDDRLEQSRSSCSGDRSLCYDPNSGRIVYKPARALMPDIPGLTRENISVKRDRIVLRYSF
jgi:hypothetical protein